VKGGDINWCKKKTGLEKMERISERVVINCTRETMSPSSLFLRSGTTSSSVRISVMSIKTALASGSRMSINKLKKKPDILKYYFMREKRKEKGEVYRKRKMLEKKTTYVQVWFIKVKKKLASKRGGKEYK
jgi:hypothetical protein